MAACSSCGAETADEARFCPTCGAVLAGELPGPREVRKTVTVLFADVTESTSLGEQLDPESLRRVMSRYFDEMKRVLERHGGTVEKFIGDAVMAVFGVPIVHEDDALRAARAAVEMREALGTLNAGLERDWGVRLAARIGVNTGEVVAVMGSPQEAQSFATGDAVNTAARLEQAAAPDEILIGPSTYALVEHAAEAEPVEPLPLRGKEKKTSAWRLVSVRAGASTPLRRLDSPLVGRVRELALLQDALMGAVEERSCRLVTVLGPPGQGKSRLAAEAAHLVGERATVLTGRCLPYGEGITYWPVIEAVRQAAGLADTDAPARQREKIAALLAAENGDAALVAERLAQVIGVGEAVGTSEETFWAVRKLLEAVARKRPLLLVLEDVHWAEPTLLDLLEYLTDWWREAPLLVLVLARPELLELRPSWSRASTRATVVDLEPLGAEESELLIENRLGDLELDEAARARVTEAAEGNPLFVEQLLAMLAEGGAPADELRVPPTLQSVLAARLELLHPEERMVIERAAVMGRAFWWEAVRELLPPEARARASEHLMALVRKELLDPEREEPGREHGFRFRHILIRDAAYAGIAKETRSELHERFASWLEARPGEYEEIIGYHLEQAFRHRAE
ncbi:MAG: adenylate/guanylate cyclase domain-containing protein, partial [Gaiellaceae bacterium]